MDIELLTRIEAAYGRARGTSINLQDVSAYDAMSTLEWLDLHRQETTFRYSAPQLKLRISDIDKDRFEYALTVTRQELENGKHAHDIPNHRPSYAERVSHSSAVVDALQRGFKEAILKRDMLGIRQHYLPELASLWTAAVRSKDHKGFTQLKRMTQELETEYRSRIPANEAGNMEPDWLEKEFKKIAEEHGSVLPPTYPRRGSGIRRR